MTKISSFQVKKSQLKGALRLPSSKSHTLRALLFALMAKGESEIHDYLDSTDTFAMIQAIEQFGARVKKEKETLFVKGVAGMLLPAKNVIDAKNSGIVYRFMAAISALIPSYTIITGDSSIRHLRPIIALLDALKELGVFAVSSRLDAHAPIIIRGPLKGGKTSINAEDSQPLSALLIASSFSEGMTEITAKNMGEKPWVNMTLHWLDRFQIPYERVGESQFIMKGSAQIKGFQCHIPGDFSSALFPIGASLITGSELTIDNVDMHDVQGDKEVISIFQKMGANIQIDKSKKQLKVNGNQSLKGITVDINDVIDALPILSVVACFAKSKTHLINCHIAKTKECNRIECIIKELKKMGADLHETEKGLMIYPSKLKGATLHSHHDHRMAMSLSVAAMGCMEDSVIEEISCINKTYPEFKNAMQSIGGQIS